jgi:hypothetical protein
VAIGDAQLTGAECFDDLQDARCDRAGAMLRAVAEAWSAATARQLACRFKPSHIRAIERGVARAGNELDRQLGRDPSEAVTFDLDATDTTPTITSRPGRPALDLTAGKRRAVGLVTRRAAQRAEREALDKRARAATTHLIVAIPTHSNRPDLSHFLDTAHTDSARRRLSWL